MQVPGSYAIPRTMSPFRLLGLSLFASVVACSAPERTFSPDDGGADGNTATVDCKGKADGTDCGGGQICLKGECASSSCGDNFVNTAGGEECEDGNMSSGDGCLNCKFECKDDADCKTTNPCINSTCDTAKHTCNTTAVMDFNACVDDAMNEGVCKMGVCVKKGCGDKMTATGEDCDDGNTDDSDGCKSDCTFGCKEDKDCDDGDLCTGAETCDTTAHKCVAGTAVDCKKSDTCVGTCDKTTGVCAYPDVDMDGVGCDKDCSDADPARFPGAFECKDGKDNDCNDATADSTAPSCLCYADSDKDGYAVSGAASIVSTAATCPEGNTRREPKTGDATTLDCREGNASVFPGQTAWFTTSYCSGKQFFDPVSGKLICSASSFDYNCDGVVTRQYNTTSGGCSRVCTSLGLCSCLGSGWTGTTVPDCGVSAQYRSCKGLSFCTESLISVQQACH
jgi:cysteine-rich repeat protein